MRGHPIVLGALAAVAAAACGNTYNNEQPVGGTPDTQAEIQRFLRRAYLDLSGHVPDDAALTTSTQRLLGQGDTAAARESLADDLIAAPAFPTVWISELEIGIFGGNSVDQQYALVCALVRGTTPACMSCTEGDLCACTCAPILPLAAERSQLRASAANFGSGTASSLLERAYATATGYYALAGSPESRVQGLFTDFLSRTAESDEVENGRAMVVGSLIAGSPAGLMFHREGATYGDLIDIVFTSEVYREAMVRRVFLRYLAREPSAAELGHFVGILDATAPDVRGVIRAVVASREYFAQ